MRKRPMCLVSLLALGVVAACATTTPEGEKVRVVDVHDETFGCAFKGPVSSKGMASINEAMKSVRNKAAALGADVIEVTNRNDFFGSVEAKAYNCAAAGTITHDAALLEAANRRITCTLGNDCEYKWSRAMEWVQSHSTWKFRTVTESLLTTEGPLETPRPAFEVAKLSQGDGRNYRITFRAWCGVGNCEGLILQLHSDFNAFVSEPPVSP